MGMVIVDGAHVRKEWALGECRGVPDGLVEKAAETMVKRV